MAQPSTRTSYLLASGIIKPNKLDPRQLCRKRKTQRKTQAFVIEIGKGIYPVPKRNSGRVGVHFFQSRRVYKKHPSPYETLPHNTSSSTLSLLHSHFYKQIFFFAPERDGCARASKLHPDYPGGRETGVKKKFRIKKAQVWIRVWREEKRDTTWGVPPRTGGVIPRGSRLSR